MITSLLRPRPAGRVYLLICAGDSLFFALITTVNLIYQVTVVGLNPLQLVLVGTVLESWYFLAEIPTGVLADRFSRRRSVVIGYVLTGLGFALEGSFPHLWAVMAAQVVWGTGAAFVSGAQEAWIVDELGQQRAASVFLRGSQAGRLASLIGIGGSVALALVNLRLSIVCGGLLYVVMGCVLLRIMSETGFTPVRTDQAAPWKAFGRTVRGGLATIRTQRVLLLLVMVAVVGGASSEGWDRLWTAHVLRDVRLPGSFGLPAVVWLGTMQAAALLISVLGIEMVRRHVEAREGSWSSRLLPAVYLGSAAAMLTFAFARSFGLALVAFWTAVALRGAGGPLWMAWANEHVDSSVRATVLSMAGQADSIGQIAAGPVVGVVAIGVSISAGLALSGLLSLPAVLLVSLAQRRHPDQEVASSVWNAPSSGRALE